MTNHYGFSESYFNLHLRERPWLDAKNVKGADASTYRVLNHAWAVDSRSVFREGKRLRDADRTSFEVLNELYARDAQRVYCVGGTAAAIADPASFKVLDDGMLDGDIDFAGYATDAQNVYFARLFKPPKIVTGADSATFVNAGRLYARDSRTLFHEGKVLRGAKPDGLEVLGSYYARTMDQVFYWGRKVSGADPQTIRVIADNHALDAKHVYDCGALIEGADPATFELIDIYLKRDARQLFVSNQPCAGIDMSSFHHLGYDYFADKHGVYWQGRKIDKAHRDSFVADGSGRAHDKKRTYVNDGKERSSGPGHRINRGWGLLNFLKLPLFLLGALTALLVTWPLSWFKRKETPANPSHSSATDLELLARTLAQGHVQALEPVMLAIRDWPAFVQRYSAHECVAEEPDYAAMLEEIAGDDDLEDEEDEDEPSRLHRPYRVLEEVFRQFGIVGVIDWRSDTGETQSQVDVMLQRLGVADFDWSFVDVLVEHGDGTELANHNFLTLLRDELAKRKLAFVHLQTFGDGYGFAVVPAGDYTSIAGMEEDMVLAVSQEFGADEAYEKGQRILAQHQN
jgi:hypothetical protein